MRRAPLVQAAIAAIALTMGEASAQIAAAPCYEADLGQYLGGGDDWIYATQPLGFAFPFLGGTRTQIDISTNGFVWLDATSNLDARGGIGTSARFLSDPPSIAILWTDLICDGRESGNGIWFHAFPGRAVITWKGFNEYGRIGLQPNFTLQMQLTAAGDATFWYSPTTSITANWRTAVAGISPGFGAADPGSTNFSAALPLQTGTQPVVYEQWSGGTFDLAQRTIEFLPNGLGWLGLDRGTCPFVASTLSSYAMGCPPRSGNPDPEFYELFPTGPVFDLAQHSIDLIPAGSGYLVAPSTAAWFGNLTNALLLGDDETRTVSLPFALPTPAGSSALIGVCSNGFLQLESSLTATQYPGPLEFQNEEARIYGLWTDLDPTAAGTVYADAISPTAFAFTWSGIAEWPFTTPAATFQIQLRSDGTISILWPSVTVTSHPVLVGFSRGHGVADPGSTDLSTALPLTTGTGSQPLLLTSTSVPILGTSLPLQLRAQPVGAIAAALVLGLRKISVPLDALGMPGCLQAVSSDATVLFPAAPALTQMPLSVPNNLSLLGYTLHAQGAELAPGVNAFGVATSNGVSLRLGTF